jgi:hypothetical protein
MKASILRTAVILLFFAGIFVSCKHPEDVYPKEISFTEYSLEETPCQWTSLEPNKVIIINSNEELESYIACTEGSFSEIDFSENSLLLVLVNDVAGCNIDSGVGELLLKQLSANEYEFSVAIHPGITANAAPFFRYIAVATEKLSKKSKVELSIAVI